ncbi:MAG: tRNA uridine-5-carboxymethylaminomethyl(34) synthesis GTPase MnmE [Gemmatimonadaceae bacterium]
MNRSRAAPLPGADDTIAAIATAVGRSALAMIRVSGPAAHQVASRVLRPWRDAPGAAYLTALHDPVTGVLIDRPVVTVYAGPRSYTGEDVVELSVHGGHLVPVLALSALLGSGARQALPGEFTRRAVVSGKMDMLQAEAVGDLIDARSLTMHEAAVSQLDGALSARIFALRDSLLELEALLAYDIDFPEEDEGPVPVGRIAGATDGVIDALDALLATAATGEVVREGAVVVIAGVPNVGKSSLFNALLGSARAIVTEVPGTTRDALEAVLDVERWPVRLVDTAGLRETRDVVERLGIEVSERYLRSADLVLACGDSAASLAAAAGAVRALSGAPIIGVRTKADLERESTVDIVADCYEQLVSERYYNMSSSGGEPAVAGVVVVSAANGAGLGELAALVARALTATHGGRTADVPLLTRERHRRAVELARQEVEAFRTAWREGALPAPVAAVHLRAAAGALEEMVGGIDVEDVLDRVFSSFCVGK